MTKKQLIEALAEYDDNAQVVFSYTYPDYWRSMVADDVKKVVSGAVAYSPYHKSWKVLDNEEGIFWDNNQAKTEGGEPIVKVIVLSQN